MLLQDSASITPLHQLELIHGFLPQDLLICLHLFVELLYLHLAILELGISRGLQVIQIRLHLLLLIVGGLLYFLLVVEDLVSQLK